jgi:hypothetical protein
MERRIKYKHRCNYPGFFAWYLTEKALYVRVWGEINFRRASTLTDPQIRSLIISLSEEFGYERNYFESQGISLPEAITRSLDFLFAEVSSRIPDP